MPDYFLKMKQRELVMLLSGFSVVVITALVAGLLVPNVKLAAATKKDIQALEAATTDGGLLQQNLEQQRSEITALSYQLQGDMGALPVQKVESFIIGRLQRVSWQNNVELISIEPATGDRVRIFQELLFNVQLIGQYADLYQWLREIREELGYVVVKDYKLRRSDDEDENPQLAAELTLASYRPVE